MSDLDEPVELASYSPDWPIDALMETSRVTSILTGVDAAIEHIGSTAIPGMLAKPVVDLQLGLADMLFADSVLDRLVNQAGYEDMGEAGVRGRRYLRRRGSTNFNLHMMQFRGLIWDNNLVLRDFLRAHPKQAKEYAAVKRSALETGATLLPYSEAKAETLKRMLVLATAWSRERR